MSLNAEIVASKVFTEEQLAKYIIDATQEVFTTMVMMDAADDYPLREPINRFKCSITGMVGFAGTYSG
ncbi:MAG: chemotaxis protein CheX, partial [Desulfuromonadales bacterium]|nr:chemotaxis protein CheX [Desulfuromonadales bacterium]